MKTKKLAVVPGESKGIGAAIAKLMRRRSVIDIVERFQTQHALQEEREMGSAIAVPGSTWPAAAAFANPVNQMIQNYKHKGNPNHEN